MSIYRLWWPIPPKEKKIKYVLPTVSKGWRIGISNEVFVKIEICQLKTIQIHF